MIPGDDDISAALPRPPIPAPARRAEAIDAALRCFDGEVPAPVRPTAAPLRRPYFGALVAATLVAVIAGPLAWESLYDPYRPPPPAPRTSSPPTVADAVGPPDAAPISHQTAGPSPVAGHEDAAPVASDRAPEDMAGPPAQAPAEPAPVVAPAPPPEQTARQAERPSPSPASADSQIVVTGSRIRQPNLVSAVPVTVIGEANLVGAASAKSARRGDWNACTLDDPAPRLAGCGPRRAPLAEGLDLAWRGDLEGALAAFDRAVARAPGSSLAYLNRGMVYQRKGDLDRARADVDRAVRLAPNSARAYYRRSLLRRQQGDEAGADSDAKRALALDSDYSAVLGE